MVLIENKSGTFADSYGDAVYTAYYTKKVWDMGNGTFLTKYGSAHRSPANIDTYWMYLWVPTPKWYNKKKRRVIDQWVST